MISPERYLYVGAHPDDDAWTAGGTLAQCPGADCVILTDGNGQGCAKTRLEEQTVAMGILGMGTLFPVGFERGFGDGSLNLAHHGPMVDALCDIIEKADREGRPYTTVVTFGRDGYSGHPDHSMVATAVEYAFHVRQAGKALKSLWMVGMSPEERSTWPTDYFVYIPKVNIRDYTPVDIATTLGKKVEAIRAHTSQLNNGGWGHIQRITTKLEPKEYFLIENR